MEPIRKSQPTVGAVHVDRPLTNISIAFLQDPAMFVADRVFSNIPVQRQSDNYFEFPRGFFNRNEAEKRAPGSESKGTGYELTTSNYFADVWAMHHDIPDQRRANADSPLQPDREAVELVSHKLLLRRESEWVTKYFVTGVWTAEDTGVSAAPSAGEFLQWNDAASTPIEDIQAGKDAILEDTGFEPNTLVISQHVWTAFKNHPDIIDRIKFGQTPGSPAVASVNTVAQVMELDRIIVAKAIQNTAAEGATDVHSFIAGKNALLAYSAPSPGLMTPSAGYTFSWTGPVGSGPAGQRMSRLRMENLRSDRIEGEMAFVQKLVSADLAKFFLTAVA